MMPPRLPERDFAKIRKQAREKRQELQKIVDRFTGGRQHLREALAKTRKIRWIKRFKLKRALAAAEAKAATSGLDAKVKDLMYNIRNRMDTAINAFEAAYADYSNALLANAHDVSEKRRAFWEAERRYDRIVSEAEDYVKTGLERIAAEHAKP